MSEKEPKSLEVSEKDQDISVQDTNDTKTEKEVSENVSNDIKKGRNDKSDQEKKDEETEQNYNDDDIELTAHDLHPAYRDLEIPFQNKEDFVPSNARTNFNESKHLDEDWVPERSVCQKDMKKLDQSAQIQVLKGISKVSQNPLPAEEGGYGKPLGNKSGTNLTNFLKIKFRDLGIRVVYKVERVNGIMKIIVVSARTDEQVYREASKKRDRHDL